MAGIVCLTLGIAIGGWVGWVLAVIGLGLLVTCCFDRREGFLLFGPFVRAEMLRSARSSRRHLWRPIYALATFGMLFWSIQNVLLTTGQLPGTMTSNQAKAMSAAIEQFFAIYAVTVLFYVITLTINVCSAVVAEERESKRWEILRTTDLRPREILFGKLFGRMPQLLDPVLASLPVLGLSTFLGGVSPLMIGLLIAGVLAGILAVGGVTLFYSVFARTPDQARNMTTALLLAYLTVSSLSWLLMLLPPIWSFPTSLGVTFPLEFGDLVKGASSGNPLAIYFHAVSRGVGFEEAMAIAVRHAAAFATLVGLSFAIIGVRRLPAAQAWLTPKAERVNVVSCPTEKGSLILHVTTQNRIRPPVMDSSIEWWERYGHLTTLQSRVVAWFNLGRSLKLGLILVLFLTLLRFVCQNQPDDRLKDVLTAIIGLTSFAFCWPVIVGALFKGARSIAKERAGETLDGLLTTPLTPREILAQKWRGAILAELPAIRIGIACVMSGMITGFIHPIGGLLYIASTAVFAAAAAALGIAVSVHAKTPTGAVRSLTIILLPFCLLLSWLVLSPIPAGMWLALGYLSERESTRVVMIALGSLAMWSVIGLGAWGLAIKRFELRSA